MEISDQVFEYVRRLHPEQRRAIKVALRSLGSGSRGDVLALTDDLEGFYRLRVGKFRIVFRYRSEGAICCEFIDTRATVYERFASMRETLE